jgi:alkylated DNA repair dioxygenase AlkB
MRPPDSSRSPCPSRGSSGGVAARFHATPTRRTCTRPPERVEQSRPASLRLGEASPPGTTDDMGSSPIAPAVAWQPSLWGNQSTVVDVSFGALTRIQLDGDSWVDHCPEWVSGSDRAFDELLRDTAWSQRHRRMYEREVDEPRLTLWLKIDSQTSDLVQWLEDARASLSTRYGVRFDSMGINLYRDGADSVAWHHDRIPSDIVDPVVALVSLGQPRRFLLRPQGGGKSRAFRLGQGDLLVTGGQTQRRFEHSVPKVKASGPRMSIAFRHGVG